MSGPTAAPESLQFCGGVLLGHNVLERAAAVTAAGFDGTSVFVGDLVGWEREGRRVAELSAEMERRGAPITALLPIIDWHPSFDAENPTGVAAEHGGEHVTGTTADALRWAEEGEIELITALGPFDGPEAPPEQVLDALGAFVDAAGALGVRVQLEVVPTSAIADVATAKWLLDGVGRDNLGVLLDAYNLGRGGLGPDAITLVPAAKIFGFELADGVAEPIGDVYFEDALGNRKLLGEGDFPVAEMIKTLAAHGPLPPLGFEVMNGDLGSREPGEVGEIAGANVRAFLAQNLRTEGPVV